MPEYQPALAGQRRQYFVTSSYYAPQTPEGQYSACGYKQDPNSYCGQTGTNFGGVEK